MKIAYLDISEARKQIGKLDERVREGGVIFVTRRHKKAFAVVGIDLMEAVFETLEILNDPDTLKMLQESLEDIKAGRLFDHEDVKKECIDGTKGLDPLDRHGKGRPQEVTAQSPKRARR